MKRYGTLFVVAVAAGVALAAVARAPRPPAAPPAEPVPPPAVERALEVGDDAVVPATSAVPKGSRVILTVTSRASAPVSVRLAGYEDRLAIESLPPGGTWRGDFVADRPGDDFAWLVAGRPAGRLMVTGSHLVEGHR